MSVPTTRTEFRDYCLRALGQDVIEINVSEEQIEDRIDEALSLYHEHHYDAIEQVYLSHQLTAGDVSNTYIQLPDSVRGVTKIFQIGSLTPGLNGTEPLSIAYQLRASDIFFNASSSLFNTSMLDYYLYKRHMTLVEELLNGQVPVRFSKHMRKLYIDGDWVHVLKAGVYIVVDCQRLIDPDVYPAIWSDHWLQKYTIELIRRQWGGNMSKYTEVRLPGGVVLNGPGMVAMAEEKIDKLEFELRSVWTAPPNMIVG